jgi:hypothetical protein
MSDWSSFEKDKEIADAWRDFLNESEVTDHEIELHEGFMDALTAKFPNVDLSPKGLFKMGLKGLLEIPPTLVGGIFGAITSELPAMAASMRDTVQLYSAWGKPAASSIGRLTQRSIEAAAERMEIVSRGSMESAASAERDALTHTDILPSGDPLMTGLEDGPSWLDTFLPDGDEDEEPAMVAEAKEAKLVVDDPAMMRRINEAMKQMEMKMLVNLEALGHDKASPEYKLKTEAITKHLKQLRNAAIQRSRYLLSKKLAMKHKQNVSAATKRRRVRDKLLSQLMAATTLEEYGEPYKQLAELVEAESQWDDIIASIGTGDMHEAMKLVSDLSLEDPKSHIEKFREIAAKETTGIDPDQYDTPENQGTTRSAPEKVKMAEKPTNFQGDVVDYGNVQREFEEKFPKGNFSEAMQAWADLIGPIFPDRYASDLASVKDDYEQYKDTIQKALLKGGRDAMLARKFFYALAKAYTDVNVKINGKRWRELSLAERTKNITRFINPEVMAIMIRNIVSAEDADTSETAEDAGPEKQSGPAFPEMYAENEQRTLNHWKLLAGIK